MAVQDVSPTIPAAGGSAGTRPSLSFQAQSVKIATGSNWVSIDAVLGGAPIPPGVVGMTWPLSYATANPQIIVTAPPQGIAPVGPPMVTALTFTDDVLTPNMGVLQTPQTVVNFALQSTVLGAFPTVSIFCGLARGCSVGLYVNSGAVGTLTVDGSFTEPDGSSSSIQITHGLTVPVGSNSDALFLSFGQGTAMPWGGRDLVNLASIGSTGQSYPMFPVIFLFCVSGAGQFTAVGSLFF